MTVSALNTHRTFKGLPIDKLLSRSAQLEATLIECLHLPPFDSSDRFQSSRIMCGVAFEHAESVKILLATGNFTSSLGLVRLQYEALVRAMWLLYAASDGAISKLMNEYSREAVGKSESIPMQADMLKGLDGKAPKEALSMLLEFREYHWKPLSSYVHGGIHAIHRHSKGYPVELLKQVLKASNGLSLMVSMHLVMLTGSGDHQGKMRTIQMEYLDSLPELRNRNL